MLADASAPTIYTVGHSTRSPEAFLALLRRERVEALVDVRAFPGSRRHPHFNRETLAAALREAGIAYEHAPALGGRRRRAPDAPPSPWRNEGFAAYADHMTTPEFRRALGALLAAAHGR